MIVKQDYEWYYTIDDAAEWTGLSAQTLRVMVRRGKLPASGRGVVAAYPKRIFVHATDLDDIKTGNVTTKGLYKERTRGNMARRETSVERSWVKWVKREYGDYGVEVIKGSVPNEPDRRVVCPLGLDFYIEFKREGGDKVKGKEPREAQNLYRKWLNGLGHTAVWANDLAEAKRLFADFWRVRIRGEIDTF